MNKLIRKIAGILPKPLSELYFKHEAVWLYIFYGGLTTIVSLASHYLCLFAGAATWLATSVSWICAATFAFFVNKFYVFMSADRSRRVIIREAWQFYAARVVSFFLELGFLLLTVDVFGQNEYLFKFIAQIFILILNYLFSKFVVFKKKTDKS